MYDKIVKKLQHCVSNMKTKKDFPKKVLFVFDQMIR